MDQPEAVYAALAAVAAITVAVELAILIALDARGATLARERGTVAQSAAWKAAVKAAKRLRTVSYVVLGLTVLTGAAALVPMATVTFGALDADWRFVAPWASTVVAVLMVVAWAGFVARTHDDIANGR